MTVDATGLSDGSRGLGAATDRFKGRRADLAVVAARLFADRGYHATSMSDLTEAAGLQRGGIYHYIDSKSDLLFLINDSVITPLAEELREIEGRRQPCELAVREISRAFVGSIADRNQEVRVFLHEWKAIQALPEWERVRAGRRELELIVERVLQRGVDEATFEIGDVRLTALGLLNMLNHSYTWFDPIRRWSARDVADAFCDIFLRGILRTDG